MAWITDVFEGINLAPEAVEKLRIIEQQVSVLESENVRLRLENQKLKDEISEVYKTKTLGQSGTLDEIQTEILKTIAAISPCFFIQIEGQLVMMLSNQGKRRLIPSAIKYQLLRLRDEGYIRIHSAGGVGMREYYSLNTKGGQYLEDHDSWPELPDGNQ